MITTGFICRDVGPTAQKSPGELEQGTVAAAWPVPRSSGLSSPLQSVFHMHVWTDRTMPSDLKI